MTDAIHREFAKYESSRTTQALPVIHAPACYCVAGSNPWQVAVNSSSIGVAQGNLSEIEMAAASSVEMSGSSGIKQDDVQEPADHWKKLLWEATISADSEHVEDRSTTASHRSARPQQPWQRLAIATCEGWPRSTMRA